MMKLRLLCVLTVCIWIGQICAGNGETFTEQSIRDQVYDVSEQFVNDFVTVEKQFQDNNFIHEIFEGINYLYGIDAEATKNSFLDSHNLPKLTSEDDCHRNLRMSRTIDKLNLLVGVKPKVKEDFLAVREQFPCHLFARGPLNYFIDILHLSGGEERKVSACMLKERPEHPDENPFKSKDRNERFVKTTEALLSTRLPDETVRGIINFQRITIADTPIDEIEKALEYVYVDVPKSECSTAESSTLKVD